MGLALHVVEHALDYAWGHAEIRAVDVVAALADVADPEVLEAVDGAVVEDVADLAKGAQADAEVIVLDVVYLALVTVEEVVDAMGVVPGALDAADLAKGALDVLVAVDLVLVHAHHMEKGHLVLLAIAVLAALVHARHARHARDVRDVRDVREVVPDVLGVPVAAKGTVRHNAADAQADATQHVVDARVVAEDVADAADVRDVVLDVIAHVLALVMGVAMGVAALAKTHALLHAQQHVLEPAKLKHLVP